MAKQPRKGKPGRKVEPLDWKEGRRLYEQEGWSFTGIGEKLGCQRNTVSRRALRESWVNRADIEREAYADRREGVYRQFVDRSAETIAENLSEKHRLAARLLNLGHQHAERLEDDDLWSKQAGPALVEEDPVRTMAALALMLVRLEKVDSKVADLDDDDGWRSERPGDGTTGDPDSEAVLAALERAAKLES